MLQWLPLQERHISHPFCIVEFEDFSKCRCCLSFNFVNSGQNILAISGQQPLWFWHRRSSRRVIRLPNGQDALGLHPCECLTVRHTLGTSPKQGFLVLLIQFAKELARTITCTPRSQQSNHSNVTGILVCN